LTSITVQEGIVNERDLADIEAIKQLKARYFRFLDQKRWADFGGVFTDDAHVDVSGDAPHAVATGRGAIVDMVSRGVGGAVTVHHGHMPEIDITGPGKARGIWAMEDYLEFPGEPPAFVVHGRGHYHEEYERAADGVWRIKSLHLVRLLLVHNGRRVLPASGSSGSSNA
jgi:hypothetical protein